MVLKNGTEIGQLVVDTGAIYSQMIESGLIRNIMPVENILQPFQKTFQYGKRNDNFKASYTTDITDHPINTDSFDEITKNVNGIATGFSYSKFELDRINSSVDPFSAKVGRVSEIISNAEDTIGIAGSGKTGSNYTQGFAHSDNNTALPEADQLNLSNMSTLKTSLNSTINAINKNAKAYSTSLFAETFPMVVMITSDVSRRLFSLASTLDDRVNGYTVFNQILADRVPNHRVIVSDLLGATTVSEANVTRVTTEGSTNMLMYSAYAPHRSVVTSDFETSSESVHGSLDYRIGERFGTNTKEPLTALYSDNVTLSSV